MLVEGNQEYVLHVKGVVPISIKLVNVREKRGQEQWEQRSATVLFLLKGKKLASDDNWALKVINGLHNHPVAQHLEGHSFAGRLTKEEVNMLIDMSKSEVKPKNILYTLQNRDIHNVSTMKTIYNACYKYKVVEKAGRSQYNNL
ncbi:hypothetical protein Dsin_019214 [Dipteronia sinensis]|uniref:Protein FAR1-RELATED SEQUENCE n=1 Tax=Dipteronia sinensis TaxID=43782 RepID=A0AAE0E2M4_9ROSI|nr:hypothetical protein Dsin_019214 [Dipteronia sinensis]